MAQTLYSNAKTRKDVILQKFLDDDLTNLGSTTPQVTQIVYLGQTTNATPTEIYIGGKAPITTQGLGVNGVNRLYIPETAAVIFLATAIAYNVTDGTLSVASQYKGGAKNVANTISAVKDYDTTTGGTQAFVLDPAFASVAVPLSQGLSFFSASEAVSFTADDTLKALTVTVTGTAAKTINWKVYLQPYTISQTSDRFYGDSAAGVGT